MKKIKSLIRKVYNKLFRRNSGRAIWEQGFDCIISESYVSKKGGISKDQATAMFRKIFAEAYPDREKFLSRVSEYKTNGTQPVFLFNGHFAGLGVVSARSICNSIEREVVLDEINKALEKWAHVSDVLGVRIDSRDEGENYVIQLRFGKLPVGDEIGREGTDII